MKEWWDDSVDNYCKNWRLTCYCLGKQEILRIWMQVSSVSGYPWIMGSWRKIGHLLSDMLV